jgi:porin
MPGLPARGQRRQACAVLGMGGLLLSLGLAGAGALASPAAQRSTRQPLTASGTGKPTQPAADAPSAPGDGSDAPSGSVAKADPSGTGSSSIAPPPAADRSASGQAPPPTGWPSLAELLALPEWMNLTLTLNAAPIANPIGGRTSTANWMQQNELNLAVGSGLAREPALWRHELDHWQARLRLDAFNGDPDFGSAIGSLFAPQSIAYPAGVYLSNVSLQRSSRDQSLLISAGYQSIDQDFLVMQPYTSYLYSGFNDTLNLTLPGLPITPYAAPSLVLHWRSPGFGSWSIGAYWLSEETDLAGLLGAPTAVLPDQRGSLQVLQWNLPLWNQAAWLRAPLQRSDGEAVPRRLAAPLLQLGAIRSNTTFLSTGESLTGRAVLRNHAVFGALTLPARLPLGLDNRFWGALQWGLNPDQNITPLFLAGGWQCQGLLPDRPLDVLSLGVGRTAFSPQLLPQLNWAGAVELNYSFQLNNRLSLQPVMQWLLRPSGDGTVPGILTTALQINLLL